MKVATMEVDRGNLNHFLIPDFKTAKQCMRFDIAVLAIP